MLPILIQTIPHTAQRYETVGDYYLDADGAVYINVSEMPDDRYEFLVALHEFVEEYLCRRKGVSEESITSFDVLFEQNRPPNNTSEPGDAPDAPYHHEHQFATHLEKQTAAVLGVDWETYNNVVNSLSLSQGGSSHEQ